MIYDLDNNPIFSAALSVPSADSIVLQIRIDCMTGYEFYADTVANLAAEGQKEGDVSWTNIETTPIDLSPWNGTRQTFNVRLTAAAVTIETPLADRQKSFALRTRKS